MNCGKTKGGTFMNKLFTKLGIAFAGIAMAVGVGAAVGSNKDVARVDATSGTPLSISSYASSNSWSNGTAYSSITYDSNITISGNTNGNNSKYYSSNNSWRQYEGDSAEITINALGGATLSSATFTYANGNSGVLKYGGTNKTSGTAISLSGTSASFSVGHSSGSKKGNIQITDISVSYTAAVTNVTVTFKANGHGTAPSSQTVQSGGKPTQPTAPTATGWTFGGWYKEQACTTAWNFSTDTVSTNTDLWAKWTATTYSISYTLDGGTHGSTHPTSGTYDTAFSVSAPTKTGYTFTGWTVTSGLNTSTAKWGTTSSPSTAISSSSTLCVNGTNAVYFKNINAASTAVTLTANWSINSYTVGGSITNGSLSSTSNVNYNAALNITINPDQDYTYPSSIDSVTMGGEAYAGYTYDSSDGSFYIEHVTGNVVINAACVSTSATPRSFTYHLTNCSIENAPESMYDTEMKVLQIVANDHYKFPASITVSGITAEHWDYDSDEGTVLINEPDGDIDLTVSCVAKAQNAISMGTLTGVSQQAGNPTSVEEGDIVSLTFVANSGYGLPTSSNVTVTGVDSESWSWDQGDGELVIEGGTSDITISITGIQRDLTDGSLTLGTKQTEYTLGDDFVKPSTITANFNLAPTTVDVKNDVVVSGVVVNGVVTGSGTVTLTYKFAATGKTQTASYTITATPITPVSGGYSEVTASKTDWSGTYVIVSAEYMLGDSISSQRVVPADLPTISQGKITSTVTDAMKWTIAPVTGGYTIRNVGNSKYLSSTGAANKAALNDTATDNSTWTIAYSDGFTITNKSNSEAGVNSILRQNGTYGWAPYNGGTGNAPILYEYTAPVVAEIKWITAELKSGDYYKGTTVKASDFTVTAHYDDGTTSTPTSDITVTNGELTVLGNNDVTLTYDGKSCVVPVNATQAPVTSVTIEPNSAEIGLKGIYSVSGITPTVLPAIAIQTTEWVVSANTVNDDYTWDGITLTAGQTEGTVTLRCRSTADNTKYDDLVVTIAGDPVAEFAKDSTSGYVGKNETISFTYGNIDDEDITIESGNTSYVTIGTISASSGSGTVVINFVGAGSTSVTIGDGSSTLDTLTVTVSADSVVSVTWSASNIDVFSGATLSTTGWNVQYEMASGDSGAADSYTIKLGSDIVTAGYTFKGSDNGKTMHVEYGGVSSSSITVTVTQRINNVNADVYAPDTSSLAFESECGGEGTADDGKEWVVESDGAESNYDNNKGIHYGTGKAAVQYIKLTSSDFTSGKITKVEIDASTASGVSATVSVKVGGNAFGGEPQALSQSAVPDNPYTFTGKVNADEVEVLITKSSSSTGALYCMSIVVTYEAPTGETIQIANNASHKAAQRVAVKFANTFNAAMDETENCTTGLDDAWSTCSAAYTTFLSEAAALGSAEEEWALNLVKYATAQYSDDSAEACIERMMKTYEICVQRHGKTAFMEDLKPLDAQRVVNPIALVNKNTNTVLIIAIVSVITTAAIGGYFFLRKRKED